MRSKQVCCKRLKDSKRCSTHTTEPQPRNFLALRALESIAKLSEIRPAKIIIRDSWTYREARSRLRVILYLVAFVVGEG